MRAIDTQVVELFVHGQRGTERGDTEATPMLAMPSVEVVEGRGIRQDVRYFRRGDPGRERRRQVSLIDEGTIWRHEKVFGPIPRNLIKAQIVLAGDVRLPDLIGWALAFPSGAALTLAIARLPCFAMDLITPGLQEAMTGGEQGALARVTATGTISLGDAVRLTPTAASAALP